MTISLSFLFIIYLILVGVVILFFLANFYHLVRFGALNTTTVLVSFLFLCGLIILAYFCYNFFSQVNWQQSITLFGGIEIDKPSLELFPEI